MSVGTVNQFRQLAARLHRGGGAERYASDTLAEPGLLQKVIALGSAAPRYPAPDTSRPELLAALA